MGVWRGEHVSPSYWLVEHFRVCRSCCPSWSDAVQSSDGVEWVETWELDQEACWGVMAAWHGKARRGQEGGGRSMERDERDWSMHLEGQARTRAAVHAPCTSRPLSTGRLTDSGLHGNVHNHRHGLEFNVCCQFTEEIAYRLQTMDRRRVDGSWRLPRVACCNSSTMSIDFCP